MSIKHTGSTTKWDEYRQRVLKVHEWLVRDVIHFWRESQRYPWPQGDDIKSSWCDIALPLWVKERFGAQLFGGTGDINEQDREVPSVLVVVDSKTMEARLHKGPLISHDDVCVALVWAIEHSREINIAHSFIKDTDDSCSTGDVISRLSAILYDLDQNSQVRITTALACGRIPRTVFDSVEEMPLLKASPSWRYVEVIIDTNLGWELYEQGEYANTINRFREWREQAGTDGEYNAPYVFMETIRPKLSDSGNEALSQAIAVLKASCNW